jgi:RNA polymerase sigma factor (sigma-70 family)
VGNWPAKGESAQVGTLNKISNDGLFLSANSPLYQPRRIEWTTRRWRTWLRGSNYRGNSMDDINTSAAVQNYLNELGGNASSPTEPVIRELLSRAAKRLEMLCATMLHHDYSRLIGAPLNLQSEELLGAVVERLMKAMRETRPPTVRQFFGLANQHIRWELNDLARRLEGQEAIDRLSGDNIPAPASSGAELSLNARRMLDAIEGLPDEEREVFSLIRIQGMAQSEVAALLGKSPKTVKRRLDRSLILLTTALADLQ